ALVAGAAAITKDSPAPELKDAHAGLKELIDRKVGGAVNAGDLQAVLTIAEKKPADKTRLVLLHEELQTSRVHEDAEIMKQAQMVLSLVKQHEPDIFRQYGAASPPGMAHE
ncbi:MAG TPA: hypothetical protein VGK81_14090, partial [Anaerolineae bacterium]